MQASSKNYHKGHVRESLIEAAEALLQQEGLAALSLRRVARDVGVAPSAVYNHFKNREALLVAVAADGYRQISALEEAAYSRKKRPETIVRQLATDYLLFACANPELYRLMFSSEVAGYRADPELYEAGDSSFGMTVNWWYGAGKYDPKMSATQYPIALALWALLHGVAMQIIDGLVTIDHRDAAAVKALARSLVGIFLQGASKDLPKSA